MKKKTFLPLFIFLACVFQWSCQQETAIPSDKNIEVRTHKGNHGGGGGGNGGGGNGGGGGDVNAIYAIQYTGSIITSDVAYMVVTESSGKQTGLHSICDATFASITVDTISTTLSGLNTLFTYLSPPSICYDDYECSTGISMSQFDKKKLPNRIFVTFWFVDPSAPGIDLRFTMWGSINGEFLPTTFIPTNIEFDKWMVTTPNNYTPAHPECLHPNTFLSDDGIPNQSLTIRLVDQQTEGDGAALCASKPGCIDIE